jgi:hypothetical protein
MKLDGKLKGGLAWAGLVVILAVPAADIVLGPRDSARTVTALPAETASVPKPAASLPKKAGTGATETASTSADPVKTYIDKNKKLPSYISDGGNASTSTASLSSGSKATLSATPAVVPATPAIAETPPVPLPRSARPKVTETEVAALPAPAKPAPALILNEKEEARAKAVTPFPLSDGSAPTDTASADDEEPVVTGDQLEEWNSGSLAQYLERKGLIDPKPAQSADAEPADDYDPDGYFLDQGPNSKAAKRKKLEEFWLF